jgi:hypothetical protein
MKTLLLGLLALGLLVGAKEATAAPISYDFTVNGGLSGPLAGVTSSGFFTFDDSIIPVGGGTVLQGGLFTDLAFSWNGIAYDESTANTGILTFDASGALVPLFYFGNNCVGAVCSISHLTNQWALQMNDEGGYFTYGLPDVFGLQFGPATYSPRAAVAPEPGTLLLFGLGGLAFARRRRRS